MFLFIILGLRVHDYEETKRINPSLLAGPEQIACNQVDKTKEYKDITSNQNYIDCRSRNNERSLSISGITFKTISCNVLLYLDGIDVTVKNCNFTSIAAKILGPITIENGHGKTANFTNTMFYNCSTGTRNPPYCCMVMFNIENAIVNNMSIGFIDDSKGRRDRGLHVHTNNKKVNFNNITIKNAKTKDVNGNKFPGGICISTSQANNVVTLNLINIDNLDSTHFPNGSAIFIKQGGQNHQITISNSRFTNCGTSGYVVVCEKNGCKFDGCIFNFTDINKSCGGLNITATKDITVINCQFIRCNRGSGGNAAGLYIPSATSNVTFQNCTFDECYGYNSRAFNITCPSTALTHSNITIQNFKLKLPNTGEEYTGYTGTFFLTDQSDDP